MESLQNRIKLAADKRILYSIHALDEMNAESDLITRDEVRDVVYSGEIIEDYPEDKRGHSSLLTGFTGNNRPVHVVCAPKDEYLAIITVYVPTVDKWEPGFKARRKKP